jgi:hypothetical protein
VGLDYFIMHKEIKSFCAREMFAAIKTEKYVAVSQGLGGWWSLGGT